ncbi:MAG: fumarylacetoacetate hydrolase family protein [Candidatus Odinarchaeum yellowstonii]|uniref:Fumarylacetoacetate hydrolase family protein n=1 Tax=Odinarchaeota yellowstonii (strain LCB_4) TaxID=1841599 RepID=A0AAF0D2P7_ODILC|nr:MAG: fumarylacetoacetate hydrolase family protein [Candidatus Odinarchaeum yellowstonii]
MLRIFYYTMNGEPKLGLNFNGKIFSYEDVKKFLSLEKKLCDRIPTRPDLFKNIGDALTPFMELNRKLSDKNLQGLKELDFNDLKFLPPILDPSKIICLGLNYADHAKELGKPLPSQLNLFSKTPNTLIAHRDTIRIPSISKCIDYEAELAIVIGRKCKNITASEAEKYILGYTIMNDVTARDLEFKDGLQWFRSKSLDTFAPIGPFILINTREFNPNNLRIRLWVNGELRQDSNTNRMVFNCYEIVADVSRDLTLLPGDIISTGTPPGIGMTRKNGEEYLKPGDVVKIEIEKIGCLENSVG